MNIPSKHIEEAVEQLASLPSIGKRSALRLVLHLLKRSPEEIERFAQAFVTMKSEVKQCTSCGNISDKELCAICIVVKDCVIVYVFNRQKITSPQRDNRICSAHDSSVSREIGRHIRG